MKGFSKCKKCTIAMGAPTCGLSKVGAGGRGSRIIYALFDTTETCQCRLRVTQERAFVSSCVAGWVTRLQSNTPVRRAKQQHLTLWITIETTFDHASGASFVFFRGIWSVFLSP